MKSVGKSAEAQAAAEQRANAQTLSDAYVKTQKTPEEGSGAEMIEQHNTTSNGRLMDIIDKVTYDFEWDNEKDLSEETRRAFVEFFDATE
jgi:3-dehydroquinate dehydratase